MRVLIIGGSGHVGTYLVPRLIEAGHEVMEMSRSSKEPYQHSALWQHVRRIKVDRKAEEATDNFGSLVAGLNADIVIDMICFDLASAQQLVESLKGKIGHFLFCGTIWVYGHSTEVPATEDQPKHPFGEYGIQKAMIEDYLLHEARTNHFPATIIRPGHIVGPGWIPVNPAGNLNTDVFSKLANGDTVKLPNLGLETLHHVHADDIAQLFMLAIANWSNSVGENFNAVSPKALTLRGYAEAVASWFGKSASLQFLPWENWRQTVSDDDAQATWDHIAHSPNCSIEKAKRLLNYQPRYTSLQALHESVNWLFSNGKTGVPANDSKREKKG